MYMLLIMVIHSKCLGIEIRQICDDSDYSF